MILLSVVLGAACGSTPEPEPSVASAPFATAPDQPVPPGASSSRISCDAEIDILCPDGYEDGCGGGRTTSTVCVKKGAIAKATCDSQIMLSCPPGEINSCFAKPPYGDKHICVRPRPDNNVPAASSPRISCDAEIAIHCPDGYEDGCGGGRTTSIACVKKGAIAAASCDSEIVLRCPAGEIDSCSARPPYGAKHICVRSGP